MTTTFNVPEITASQTNKYLTHNEALRQLESYAAGTVLGTLTLPPTSSIDGDLYIVGTGATGAWTGFDEYIAKYEASSNSWLFFTPAEGMTLHYGGGGGYQIRFASNVWTVVPGGISTGIDTIQFKNNFTTTPGGTVFLSLTGRNKLAFDSARFTSVPSQPSDTVCISLNESPTTIRAGNTYSFLPVYSGAGASQVWGATPVASGMTVSATGLNLIIDDACIYKDASDAGVANKTRLGRFGRGIQRAYTPTITTPTTNTVNIGGTIHHVATVPNSVCRITSNNSNSPNTISPSSNFVLYLPGSQSVAAGLVTRGTSTGNYTLNANLEVLNPFDGLPNNDHGVWRIGDSITLINEVPRTGSFSISASANMVFLYDKGLSNFTQVGALTITLIYGKLMTNASDISGDDCTWLIQGGHA